MAAGRRPLDPLRSDRARQGSPSDRAPAADPGPARRPHHHPALAGPLWWHVRPVELSRGEPAPPWSSPWRPTLAITGSWRVRGVARLLCLPSVRPLLPRALEPALGLASPRRRADRLAVPILRGQPLQIQVALAAMDRHQQWRQRPAACVVSLPAAPSRCAALPGADGGAQPAHLRPVDGSAPPKACSRSAGDGGTGWSLATGSA